METHAAACVPCRTARERIEAARRAMEAIAGAPPPELRWESIGVRIGWTVSSELRRREREAAARERSRAARRAVAVAVAATGALAVGVWLARGGPSGRTDAGAARAKAALALDMDGSGGGGRTKGGRAMGTMRGGDAMGGEPPQAANAPALEGVVTLLQGQVLADGMPVDMATGLRTGSVVETRSGRVAVQFGPRTGLLLEPQTRVEILSLDPRAIELGVHGEIGVEVKRHGFAERVVVRAGSRAVEVRGTAFRVAWRHGALDVAVARGRVVVVEGDDAVEIPAGSRLRLAPGARPGRVLPTAMGDAQARALADGLRLPLVPGFRDAAQVRAETGALRIAARPSARVRVDGVTVGAGPLSIRAAPGRHLVEVGAASRWIEIDSQSIVATDLDVWDLERSERPRQFDAQLEAHRAAFEACRERMRKFDPLLEGEIVVEVGIAADGSVGFVTALKGLPEHDLEACLLGVVRDRFTFPPGSAATIRKRIRF